VRAELAAIEVALVLVVVAAGAGCARQTGTLAKQPVSQAVPAQAVPVQVATADESLQQTRAELQAAVDRQTVAETRSAEVAQQLAALEGRTTALEQSLVRLTQENEGLRQRLAQTETELRATQEQLRSMQAQARAARRAVEGWIGRQQY
jgi:septal ring factor EnvC (AmiA/AmiB activator)